MKRVLLSALLLLNTVLVSAQVPDVPRIIPPSPDAVALGNFGNYKVDNNAGTAGVDIPVYTISTPRFNVPISLNYIGGNGIKVDERPSWVGLGWALNVGGVISRTIIGGDDTKYNGYLNLSIPNLIDIGTTNYGNVYLSDASKGEIDTKPDYFFFNFNGRSGKFVFDETGKPIFIESAALKLSYSQNNGFVIIDEEGNTYNFNVKELVSSGSYQGTTTTAVSSWYLSEMISADKTDTVSFQYELDAAPTFEFSYDFNQIFGMAPGCMNQEISFEERTDFHRDYTPQRLKRILFKNGKVELQSTLDRLDGGARLNSIKVFSRSSAMNNYTELKTANFHKSYFYSDLQNPVSHGGYENYRLRLDSLSMNNNTGESEDKYSFSYSAVNLPPVNNFAQDEWGYFNGKIQNTSLLKSRTQLVGQYVVNIGSANRDVSPAHIEAGILKKVIFPTKGYTEFTYELNKYTFSDTTYVPHSISCIANGGMTPTNTVVFTAENLGPFTITVELRKIGDLTGLQNRPFVRLKNLTTGQIVAGYSAEINTNTNLTNTIELIPGNQYELYAEAIGNSLAYAGIYINYQVPQVNADIRQGFGLRIQKISNYEADNTLKNYSTYGYGKNESGVGIVMSKVFNRMPQYYDKSYVQGTQPNGTGCIACQATKRVYLSSSFYQLSTLNGNSLVYDNLTIYNGNSIANNGKIIYKYGVFEDASISAPFGYPNGLFQVSNSWLNGKIDTISYFDNIEGVYNLKKQISNQYENISGSSARGIEIGLGLIGTGCSALLYPPVHHYYYFNYPIYSGIRLLKKTTERHFSNGSMAQIQQTSENFYNSLFQVVKTEGYDSDQKNLNTEYKYPLEMVNSNNDPQGVYQTMLNLNIIKPVIDVKKTKVTQVVGWERTNYTNPFNHMYLPDNVMVYNVLDTQWEERIKYRYYPNGQLYSLSKDGKESYFIWSFNSQYPIAKIENSNFNFINTALGGTQAISSFANSIPTNNTEVDVFLSPIRNNSTTFKDTQITTYTYKPLVGMTSQTDPKGMTTYYEYDSFQRLKYVKDQNGNIIKANEYHYKP